MRMVHNLRFTRRKRRIAHEVKGSTCVVLPDGVMQKAHCRCQQRRTAASCGRRGRRAAGGGGGRAGAADGGGGRRRHAAGPSRAAAWLRVQPGSGPAVAGSWYCCGRRGDVPRNGAARGRRGLRVRRAERGAGPRPHGCAHPNHQRVPCSPPSYVCMKLCVASVRIGSALPLWAGCAGRQHCFGKVSLFAGKGGRRAQPGMA